MTYTEAEMVALKKVWFLKTRRRAQIHRYAPYNQRLTKNPHLNITFSMQITFNALTGDIL